jgi:hypothetical protein
VVVACPAQPRIPPASHLWRGSQGQNEILVLRGSSDGSTRRRSLQFPPAGKPHAASPTR